MQSCIYSIIGNPSLSGSWIENKEGGKIQPFVTYLQTIGVLSDKADFIAKTKRSAISLKFHGGNPMIFTIIGALVPDDNPRNAKISMNYTNVKADNKTMYPIPMNMLTGNMKTSHVIFGWRPGTLTLYAVDKSKDNIKVSFEWSVSSKNPNEMKEKWVHVKTGKNVVFYFEKVNSTCQDKKKYCSYAPDCKLKEVKMDCPHLCDLCPKGKK